MMPIGRQGDPRVCNDQLAYISQGSILVDEKSSNDQIANLNVGPRVQDNLKLSPSGKYLLFWLDGSGNSCYLWSIDTQTVYRLDGFGYYIKDSPDGHFKGTATSPFGPPVQAPLSQFSTLVTSSAASGAFLQMDDTLLQLTCIVESNHGT